MNTIYKEKKAIKKPGSSKNGLPKSIINIIRTTQRNNIDLTAIADNKANVLLSLNAIMITCLVPIVFAYFEVVIDKHFVIPLSILAITCFSTIYMATQALRPSGFNSKRKGVDANAKISPFFFGNYYRMEAREYNQLFEETLSDPNLVKAHMAQDIFFLGKRLGEKMGLINWAFNIFISGIFLTLLSAAFVLTML